VKDAYDIRTVAESVIGEDRVPTDELIDLIRAYGSDEHHVAAGFEESKCASCGAIDPWVAPSGRCNECGDVFDKANV
jgi:hypothetical protein